MTRRWMSNKAPAKHRDIFHRLKKSDDGEIQTH